MTLQPSEPDFMLERNEGSVVIEKPYKKEKESKKKKRDVSQAGAVTRWGP